MNIIKFVLYSLQQNTSGQFVLTQFNRVLFFLAFQQVEIHIVSMNMLKTGNIENGNRCALVFILIVFILTKYLQQSKTFARKVNNHPQIAT